MIVAASTKSLDPDDLEQEIAADITNARPKRKPPMAGWRETWRDKGGRVHSKTHIGAITYMNAFYRELHVVIDGCPTVVPWEEKILLQPLRFAIYNAGGVW